MLFKRHNRPSIQTAQQLEIVGVPSGVRSLSSDEISKRLWKVYGGMKFKSKEQRIQFFKEQYEFFKQNRMGEQKMRAEEKELWEWFEKVENGWEQKQKGQQPSLTEDPMLRDLLKERGKLCNRIENTGWRRIPNTSGMSIIQGSWNVWLKGTGFDRRISRTVKLKKGPSDRSRNMNKYLTHEVQYLRKLVARGELNKFWKVSWRLMERSIAFRTAAFNYCFYGWYKYRSVNEVIRINLTANRIIKERWSKIDFMRVFIPKANGKLRPLGVPTCAWRLVLHMYSNFLGILLRSELSAFNHAYLPQKGTLTCITEWVTKVLKQRYVYEFDIKGFFDNVSVKMTLNKLEERGLPTQMVEHWVNLLESTPWNIDWKKGEYIEKKDKEGNPIPLTEMDRNLGERAHWASETKNSMISTMETMETKRPDRFWKLVDLGSMSFDEYMEATGGEDILADVDYDGQQKIFEIASETQIAAKLSPFHEVPEELNKGLPQGAAISPVLSLLALVDWKKKLADQGIGLLMYADDGILYANKEFAVFPPEGFEIAPEKSGWVKRDGKWEKDSQKFLGIRYHQKTDLISGETRSGKTLEFGRTQLNVLELIRSILPTSWSSPPPTRLDALMRSSLKGQAASRLYNGIWDSIDWPEHWHISMKDDSWWCIFKGSKESLIARKKLQTTASSYACHWLGGLLTSIINPKLNKHGKQWEEARGYGSPSDMNVPLKLKDLQGPGFILVDAGKPYVNPNCNWREWLKATIKHFGVRRSRKRIKPTPQDIAESVPLNMESASEPAITKRTSNGSRPSTRQAGPTSGFPVHSKELSGAKRKRVLPESNSLKRAIKNGSTLQKKKNGKRYKIST